jgi:hypothetical protein
MRYLIPMLHDLGEMLKGRRLAPIEFYEAGRKSLHFVGYEGRAMIAVAGIDMAAWDALARAAGLPLCMLLGGSIGEVLFAAGPRVRPDQPVRPPPASGREPATTMGKAARRHHRVRGRPETGIRLRQVYRGEKSPTCSCVNRRQPCLAAVPTRRRSTLAEQPELGSCYRSCGAASA